MNRKHRTLTAAETARRRKINGRTLTVLGVAALTLASCGAGASIGARRQHHDAPDAHGDGHRHRTREARAGHREDTRRRQAFDEIAEWFDAVSRIDAEGVQNMNTELAKLTPKIEQARSDYDAAAEKCRAAA